MAMKILQLCNSITRKFTTTTTTTTLTHQHKMTKIPSLSTLSEANLCGRGDKRTKRGKRFKGSFGNSRPKKKEMIQRLKEKLEVPTSTPWPLPFKLI
ncbi:hypothetical protein vseg_012706 [Gypsophila vaccaria]